LLVSRSVPLQPLDELAFGVQLTQILDDRIRVVGECDPAGDPGDRRREIERRAGRVVDGVAAGLGVREVVEPVGLKRLAGDLALGVLAVSEPGVGVDIARDSAAGALRGGACRRGQDKRRHSNDDGKRQSVSGGLPSWCLHLEVAPFTGMAALPSGDACQRV